MERRDKSRRIGIRIAIATSVWLLHRLKIQNKREFGHP